MTIHRTYRIGDTRLVPAPEPREIGICAGCHEPIIAGEVYYESDFGFKVHDNDYCILKRFCEINQRRVAT